MKFYQTYNKKNCKERWKEYRGHKNQFVFKGIFKKFTISKKNVRAENDYLSNRLLLISNEELDRLEKPDEMPCKINIIEEIYGQKFNHKILKSKVLLAARNDDVNKLNLKVLSIASICETYDFAKLADGDDTDDNA